MIKEKLEKIKLKLSNKNLIFPFFALAIFFFALFCFHRINKKKSELVAEPTPTPTPLVTIEEVITASPSAYATDEAVLKIEEELKILEEKLNVVDLEEQPLLPPFLDMDVKF